MLVQKSFATGDIISIKLTSGEETIARYQSETLTEYQITRPVSLVPTQQGTLGMLPALFSAELNTNINLQKTAVAFMAASRKEVADEYISATTNIRPASNLEGLINAKGS